MELTQTEPLFNIDGIEQLKREYHESTGKHVSVKLLRNSIDVRITDKPIRPNMLPLKQVVRMGRIRKSIRIKVKKG